MLRKCQELGIGLSKQDIDLFIQLIFFYLSHPTCNEGHLMLYRLLKRAGFTTQKATYLKTHFKSGFYGMDEGKLPASSLEEMRLWLYNDSAVKPYGAIEVMDRPDQVACDDCGILGPAQYCSMVVTEIVNGKERTQSLCNHCRLYRKEDPNIRDTAKRSTCEDCKIKTCTYWAEFHRVQPTPDRPAPAQHQQPKQQLEYKPVSPGDRYSSL